MPLIKGSFLFIKKLSEIMHFSVFYLILRYLHYVNCILLKYLKKKSSHYISLLCKFSEIYDQSIHSLIILKIPGRECMLKELFFFLNKLYQF